MSAVPAFLFGALLGCWLGILIMCLMFMARDPDDGGAE
jgi:hypothetical protein